MTKILHIARWAGPRVYKQVIAQQEDGWDVTLMSAASGYPGLHRLVNKFIGWPTRPAMAILSDIYEVIVIHTTIATNSDAEELPGHLGNGPCRLVWDCHDFMSATPQDKYAAIITPSKGVRSYFRANTYTVYSKAPACLVPEPCIRPRINACCLVATIGNGEPWSNYEGISERIGIPVFIYPSTPDYQGHKGELMMQKLPYMDMLRAIRKFKYGYAGSANPAVTIHDCVTNKFWDYLVVGVDPIPSRSDEMRDTLTWSPRSGPSIYMEWELDKMRLAYGTETNIKDCSF